MRKQKYFKKQAFVGALVGGVARLGARRLLTGALSFGKSLVKADMRAGKALLRGGPKAFLRLEKRQFKNSPLPFKALQVAGYASSVNDLAKGRPLSAVGYTVTPTSMMAVDGAKAVRQGLQRRREYQDAGRYF